MSSGSPTYRKSTWQKFAASVKSAEYVDNMLTCGVDVKIGGFVVNVDCYRTSRQNVYYTRAKAAVPSSSSLRFSLTRKVNDNILDDFGRMLAFESSKRVKVGHFQFDEKFVLKSNQPDKIRSIFAVPKMRDLVLSFSTFDLKLRGNPVVPLGAADDRLYLKFHSEEFITSVQVFKNLCILYSEILRQL
jgi:hypothetical protein